MTSADDERAKQLAEVLRLHLTEGQGIRAIARVTKLGRKKVRKLLALAKKSKAQAAAQQRSSILAPYEDATSSPALRRCSTSSPARRSTARSSG